MSLSSLSPSLPPSLLRYHLLLSVHPSSPRLARPVYVAPLCVKIDAPARRESSTNGGKLLARSLRPARTKGRQGAAMRHRARRPTLRAKCKVGGRRAPPPTPSFSSQTCCRRLTLSVKRLLSCSRLLGPCLLGATTAGAAEDVKEARLFRLDTSSKAPSENPNR